LENSSENKKQENIMNQEELKKIEEKRKTAYSAILTINITIGVLIAITIISFTATFISSFTSSDISNSNFKDFFPIPFITIPLAVILIFANRHIKNSISKEISKTIYEPAFKEKDTEFSYNDGLTLSEVMLSDLFPYPDRFISDNLTKGEISNFPYKASNITLLREHEETDENGHTHTYTTTVFDGRMYIIETPFNKKGIILKPKKIGKEKLSSNINSIITLIILLIITGIIIQNTPFTLSNLSPKEFLKEFKDSIKEEPLFFIILIITLIMIIILPLLSNRKKGYQKAQLESSQFNEYFYIETQDQVELRKALTPAVMERLINLRNSIGEFHLSIIGNKIFFAFPKSFDIKYSKPIQKLIEEAKKSIEREIETIKSIIETLKLEEEKIKKGINND
jgi:hypothetical protein